MIPCIEGTVTRVDERVLGQLRSERSYRSAISFDRDYLLALPSIHGGTPIAPYFTDSTGATRRVGWFVSMYDEQTELPGPVQEDHMYHDSDTRVVDRSLPYLLKGEMSIYAAGENESRFYPFAALCEDSAEDSSAPFSLAWHFGCGNDSLCFDTSTTPSAVVYCNFHNAVAALNDWEYNGKPYDYGHLVPVAPSFKHFAHMLRPQA